MLCAFFTFLLFHKCRRVMETQLTCLGLGITVLPPVLRFRVYIQSMNYSIIEYYFVIMFNVFCKVVPTMTRLYSSWTCSRQSVQIYVIHVIQFMEIRIEKFPWPIGDCCHMGASNCHILISRDPINSLVMKTNVDHANFQSTPNYSSKLCWLH